MTNYTDRTMINAANELADRLEPPDDLLVRVLIAQTLLVALDPTSPLFTLPPLGFDSRPLVVIGTAFFKHKDWLRDALISARGAYLKDELVRIAGEHYRSAPHLDFVRRASVLLFSKPRLLLNILDGGRDPFEGICG